MALTKIPGDMLKNFKLAVRAVATTDSPTVADDVLLLSGASFTMTLPTAVGNTGKIFSIVHGGTSLSQAYTLNTTSAQTIGGVASGSYVLYTNGERLRIVSDGANWVILDHFTSTAWISYTPTFTGFGTASDVDIKYRRDGTDILISGNFTIGTATAVEGRVTLPGTITVASGINATGEIAGVYQRAQATSSAINLPAILINSSQQYFKFAAWTTTVDGLAAINGNSVGSATEVSLQARIPITGWQP